jgi:hypothetical protein
MTLDEIINTNNEHPSDQGRQPDQFSNVLPLADEAPKLLRKFRHPEARAKRASKGDGPGASAASFEGRFAATSG